ncbi:MAG: hypothetical protein ACWA5L_05245 [bacterium]
MTKNDQNTNQDPLDSLISKDKALYRSPKLSEERIACIVAAVDAPAIMTPSSLSSVRHKRWSAWRAISDWVTNFFRPLLIGTAICAGVSGVLIGATSATNLSDPYLPEEELASYFASSGYEADFDVLELGS